MPRQKRKPWQIVYRNRAAGRAEPNHPWMFWHSYDTEAKRDEALKGLGFTSVFEYKGYDKS